MKKLSLNKLPLKVKSRSASTEHKKSAWAAICNEFILDENVKQLQVRSACYVITDVICLIMIIIYYQFIFIEYFYFVYCIVSFCCIRDGFHCNADKHVLSYIFG